MNHILQICTGAWNTSNYPTEAIIERIRAIASKTPVDKVIIGWAIDKSLYRELGSFLHERGIQMMLWLPCELHQAHAVPQDRSPRRHRIRVCAL